jgi:glycosyltransferase A (GT-A) superfamily protein (DUF2064 family)
MDKDTVDPPPVDDDDDDDDVATLHGAIVVVAKCPIQGTSKTRLMPLLGPHGSVALAKSMLADVLWTVHGCDSFQHGVYKILMYAPGNEEGMTIMKGLLEEWGIVSTTQQKNDNKKSSWILVPMPRWDLQSSDLGSILEHALVKVRTIMDNNDDDGGGRGGVVFLGMDAPQLSLEDIAMGLWNAQQDQSSCAMLCPADDGGYGMLCVPPHADPTKTFADMYWSHRLTAVSQIKALTDQKIMVSVGKLMHDIDEPEDVHALCKRLKNNEDENEWKDLHKNLGHVHIGSQSMTKCFRRIRSSHPPCQYTLRALEDAGLL